jgi:hypothetical protein
VVSPRSGTASDKPAKGVQRSGTNPRETAQAGRFRAIGHLVFGENPLVASWAWTGPVPLLAKKTPPRRACGELPDKGGTLNFEHVDFFFLAGRRDPAAVRISPPNAGESANVAAS